MDSRLRAGESQADLAREFQFSADAVARHAANHLRREKVVARTDLHARLEQAAEQAEELLKAATATGDHRSATDCLRQLVAIIESLSRLRVQASSFEEMSESEQVDYLFEKNGGKIPMAYLDRIIGDDLREVFSNEPCPSCGHPLTKSEAEKIHGQSADSSNQVN